jgi:hypothetical protein
LICSLTSVSLINSAIVYLYCHFEESSETYLYTSSTANRPEWRVWTYCVHILPSVVNRPIHLYTVMLIGGLRRCISPFITWRGHLL